MSGEESSHKCMCRGAAEEDTAAEIHEASLALLEEPGVRIENEEIYGLLVARGAKAGRDTGVVRLDRKMVEEHIALCPKEFSLSDRAGNGKSQTATAAPVIWSTPGLNLCRDGVYRAFTSGDMGDMARLLEQLENVDVVFGMALDDVPPAARDAVGLKTMAFNSKKHLRPLSFSPEGARVMVEMKKVVGEHAWFSVGFTAHGPLRWTNLALEIFRQTAGHGIPVSINGEPMAGVSGPVTLAGASAVGNAEILAGIVINQILEPGRPCIYNLGLAHVFDMRTAIAVTGGPENALFAKVAGIMGRFYDMPSASWVSTESMCHDEQAALEKMFGWHTHMEAGVTDIWGVGQLESEISLSPAQAVIDDEMVGYAKRFARGFETSEETLALGVTREVGIAGSFLDQMHTAQHFRSELFMPKVLWRDRRAIWKERGGKRLEERAEAIADELMGNEVDNGLSVDQEKALDKLASDFVRKAQG